MNIHIQVTPNPQLAGIVDLAVTQDSGEVATVHVHTPGGTWTTNLPSYTATLILPSLGLLEFIPVDG